MPQGNVDISKKIAEKVKELKSTKGYDPRREIELNEIYDRYVPPHSMTQTSHLVDVAERDAYVDPFPPIASNKKAGVIVKKGIRAGFGWYAQFLSQQISTFGSGVSRALRSINSDVEELKRKVAIKKIPNFIYELDLDNVNNETFEDIVKSTISLNGAEKMIVSDSLDNVFLNVLHKSAKQLIVVDERAFACAKVDGEIDSRKQNLVEFLSKLEESSVDSIILSGLVNFYELGQRLEIFELCSKVLTNSGVLVFVAITNDKKISSDQKCALEVFDTNILQSTTYEKILSQCFAEIITREIKGTSNSVFYCTQRNIDATSNL